MTDQEYNKKLFEENLPGLSYQEALEWLKDTGYTLRVMMRNGQPCIVTRDFKTNRINVEVENDKIKSFRSIG